ncbi:hypothetical protein BDV37DRAFT_259065 [Aspergillus pseudonomiae]|uniref:Uncharacterized protein n=1 Tax=Aspergillus pseudonomiae TaxID=1506151 RepID=A0A5N7D235_9EURO|nr:uncharacterized protein BDV37DRAFT_259065 [Aspergillus pseudonomiae]KAE8399898.1 hypothetical protein BDV37DRAFT_259065 [Aspergillus pseudonomiae]
MVQGSLKKKAGTGPKRPRALGPKPGPRQIAPKKQSLIKQQKMTKKLTAGLISKTERNLAQKAGHLELLAGGKKDKKKESGNGNKGGK